MVNVEQTDDNIIRFYCILSFVLYFVHLKAEKKKNK